MFCKTRIKHENIKLDRCPQCHCMLFPLSVPLTVVDICDKPTVVKTGKY